jgi:hypothetical protein
LAKKSNQYALTTDVITSSRFMVSVVMVASASVPPTKL